MAHGFKEELEGNVSPKMCTEKVKTKPVREGKGMGSRRIFSPQFKLRVLDSYRQDADCRGNQRATARKYGIHRRQIQKWLQMEKALRCTAEGASDIDVALNLASTRQRDDNCRAGCLAIPETKSDSDDDISSNGSDQEHALDFTCAALSKRRFFSDDFKTEVVDAFYNDTSCYGNQRATARKFGIHRRQVQKWLDRQGPIRNDVCLDLSYKRKYVYDEEYHGKRTFIDLDAQEKPTSVQETALCLVKQPSPAPEVTSSSHELFRPYQLEENPTTPPIYTSPWSPQCCQYYGPIQASCITKWLNDDVHYYKQAVKEINLYSPLYS